MTTSKSTLALFLSLILSAMVLARLFGDATAAQPHSPKSAAHQQNDAARPMQALTLTTKQQKALLKHAKELQQYAVDHHFYSQKLFLVDMSIKSANYRYFVVNSEDMSVVDYGLVAHGSGSRQNQNDFLVYSNTPDSLQTALGKYRIGERYLGKFGLAYKLHGLESSNDNAYRRAIVLHGFRLAWEKENGLPFIQSEGCPMVAPEFLDRLDGIIKDAGQPVMLDIYDSSQI